ncbi:hypothetical protein CEXT_640502 [Caerostris extrusa]|uniref:Uncharacterized protein n=1 Tax=Caerostris extrusa TaxID=172846 RepID=A0AAV4WZZ8_CAEEX|nr:hypothetical protein CEXT_640502 [Caerostris extrusa]
MITPPLNQAIVEIGENDVNMTESSPLSPNSLPETTSELTTSRTSRPISPSSCILQFNPGPAITADIQAGRLQTSQDIDAAIAKLETTKNSRGDVINHKSRHRKTRLSTTHQQLPNLQ